MLFDFRQCQCAKSLTCRKYDEPERDGTQVGLLGRSEASAAVALGCRRLSRSEVEGLSAEDAKRTIEQLMSALETFERLECALRAFLIPISRH